MILNKKYVVFVALLLGIHFTVRAQFKATITNLNSKEEIELKVKEVFYFGIINSNEKYQGTLEEITGTGLIISGKTYTVADITWIDFKGHTPKKHSAKIARVLLYFGVGLMGTGAYKYYTDNDKTNAEIIGIAGGALSIGALCFWLLPRQAQYNFSTSHLLEIVPQIQETK